jgi:hypothetical protein
VIIREAPGDCDGHFVGFGTVEDPMAQAGEPFQDIERVLGAIAVDVGLVHVDPQARRVRVQKERNW